MPNAIPNKRYSEVQGAEQLGVPEADLQSWRESGRFRRATPRDRYSRNEIRRVIAFVFRRKKK
jgi:hypothetical protein